jgi:hypothetical protein
MVSRTMATIVTAALLAFGTPASAENQMGYKLVSVEEASRLPQNHGTLGLDVERAQQITDGGMTFDIIRVKQVRSGLAGDQAGFRKGDQIIAVDGHVFPSITTFATYVGSIPPGRSIHVDYIPAGEGPGGAERLPVRVGSSVRSAQTVPERRQEDEAASTGMSTRMKIGLGAAALLGCYELGCFSSRTNPGAPAGNQQQPYGAQRR